MIWRLVAVIDFETKIVYINTSEGIGHGRHASSGLVRHETIVNTCTANDILREIN
jgi:hypothetical protein